VRHPADARLSRQRVVCPDSPCERRIYSISTLTLLFHRFKKGEQAGATSLWYSMNALQTAVGGLLALAFFQIQGAALRSWQIMFLVL
jgi:hypothetical protein